MKTDFTNENEFYGFLMGEIAAEARIQDEEKSEEEVFVERMLDYLHESNFLENGVPCTHHDRYYKIDAYDMNATENSIDILVACFKTGEEAPFRLGKPDIERSFKKAWKFLDDSRINRCTGSIGPEHDPHDLSLIIHESFNHLKRARLILITNGFTDAYPGQTQKIGQFEVTQQIWDFTRLWRQVSSGMKKEYITVELTEEGFEPLECLMAEDGKGIYTTYMAIVPGKLLRNLYDKYGTRLLERNVRAFLQARSNVNRGIRDTIIDNPHLFLAYNNGITVTANSISLNHDESGQPHITQIRDFQVVNGGQTVASLWHTSVRNKAHLDLVNIQMKLTVINKPENIDIIAPRISEYSNAQNKVNTADFSANDPFHIELEGVVQSIWAPDSTGGNRQTKWYYERSRGSYAESKAQQRTPAAMRKWEQIHPRKQKFDKLMVAKMENTWRQLPHIVSLGGQKNFAHFTVHVKELIEDDREIDVNHEYAHHLVAKLIIWKAMETIVRKQNKPGYRANIITYSIAWLLRNHNEVFKLDTIWEKQSISEELETILDNITDQMRSIITDTQGNVTEYCKKEECWRRVRQSKLALDEKPSVGIKNGGKSAKTIKREINWDNYTTNSELWKSILQWNEDTRILTNWESDFCKNVENLISRKKAVSAAQIQKGEKILNKCYGEGFKQMD